MRSTDESLINIAIYHGGRLHKLTSKLEEVQDDNIFDIYEEIKN